MKFVLVLTLCSSIYNSCMKPIQIDEVFDSHYDCAIAGYAFSGEAIKNFGNQKVNDEVLYISFGCKKLDNI
jgi:hypothetical protein